MPKNKTILLIDDDNSLRRVTEYALHQAGYRVITAEDGERGLELFALEGPVIVITDIQMPGLSGYDVLERVKAEAPETLVIVITAHGTLERAVAAMKAGAYDYIAKPFSHDELAMVVDKAYEFLGLRAENLRLREKLDHQVDFGHMVGISNGMQDVFDVVRRVAPSDATVLISGESGTGKELIARAIHQGSDRHARPFVAVNCAAIPADLLESELFGHVKGAFTGAVRDRQGKFAQADGGTLFLDEVGELPMALQPKLLRALQELEVEPVGGQPFSVDVRVVAATNQDINQSLADGAFREDLYYRLAVIPVNLPPLRERPDDIPLLTKHFLEKYGGSDVGIDDDALERLGNYLWPGNVREMENAIQRMLILKKGDRITSEDLPNRLRGEGRQEGGVLTLPAEGYPLEEIEKEAVLQALQRNQWNQTRAAEFLRIPRHTLIYRMEKYDIKKQ